MNCYKGLSVSQIMKEYKIIEGWSFNKVGLAADSGDSEKVLLEIMNQVARLANFVNVWAKEGYNDETVAE